MTTAEERSQELDVWIDRTPDNVGPVWRAPASFGAPSPLFGVQPMDLEQPDEVVQFGLPPNRIDILTGITGVPDFIQACSRRLEMPVRGRTMPFLNRLDFVANKRAAGRPKDLGDLDALGER